MGGQLSIHNSTKRRLFATLEQTPYSARYWGHIAPQDKWHQPISKGYYVLRVFDIDTLPGEFREPHVWSEALKSVAYGVGGALLAPLIIAEFGLWLAWGTTPTATNDATRWVVPETGQRAQAVEPLRIQEGSDGPKGESTSPSANEVCQVVLPGIHIGKGTAFEVIEDVNGKLEIRRISDQTPGANRWATPMFHYHGLSGESATNQPGTPIFLHGNSDPGSKCVNSPTVHSVTPEAYLHGFDATSQSEGKTFPLNGYGLIKLHIHVPQDVLNEPDCKIAVNTALTSRYLAHVFYQNDSANTWIVHFVIVRNLDLCVNAINEKYGALKRGPDLEVSFHEDRITLDIPEEGDTEMNEGWKITPLMPPTITKKQVDDYTPGRRIPSCQFNVMWNEFGPRHLLQRVNLMGVEEPNTFFCIRICLPISQDTTGSASPHLDSGLTVNDRPKIMMYLKKIGNNQDLLMVGESLGLDGNELKKNLVSETFLFHLVGDWLDRKYRVDKVGTPTWNGLIQALEHVGQSGLANDIKMDMFETL